MPPRRQTPDPLTYHSHQPLPPKSRRHPTTASKNHKSKKMVAQRRIQTKIQRMLPHIPPRAQNWTQTMIVWRPDSTIEEPPKKAKQQGQQAPVNDATLSRKEIKEWRTCITDENSSRHQQRIDAVHFLGVEDCTQVTSKYRLLSLQLHPNNQLDEFAKALFQVLSYAKGWFK